MSEDRSSSDEKQYSWWQKLLRMLPGEPKDREHLLRVLRAAQRRGLYDADAEAMIEGVLQVADMQVREVMIPRSQVAVVPRDAAPADILPLIVECGHSRFPVIGDNRDEVVGILLAKDLLRHCKTTDSQNFSVRDLLRPAVFVPGSKRLNVLLKEFRASRNHIAIVVDEYGGVAGMVTIEDVLEQIVGEIEDEHDVDEDTYILKHGDKNYTLKALTPVEDFNEYFGTDLNEEEFDTVGGLVMGQLGYLPKRGEIAVVENLSFKVLRADNRRIHVLQLTILPRVDEQAEPPAGSA